MTENDQLKEFIANLGLISKMDLDYAENQAIKYSLDLGTVLINQGKISRDDLCKVRASVLGIPFINLKGLNIDFETLSLIPEPLARFHNIISFKKTDETIEVAMLDKKDLISIDFLKKNTGLLILPRLSDVDSIKSALIQYQKGLKAEFGDLIKQEINLLETIKTDTEKLTDDPHVIRVVEAIFKHAKVQNASDILIEAEEDVLLIRYRINGSLHEAMKLPKSAEKPIAVRIKTLASMDVKNDKLPQEGQFVVESPEEKIIFRVSVMPTFYGEKIFIRFTRANSTGQTLEKLGFHGETLEQIYTSLGTRQGMVLVTGPEHSGKSSVLYALLDILNTPDVDISTIEDPIKYQIPRINQTKVRPDIGLTFSNGLRFLLRQDPDVVLVGEMRDAETALLSLNASLSGHFILSAISSPKASTVIPHLVDMKIDRALIGSTLSVIISTRLVRRLDSPSERRALSKNELSALSKVINLDKMLDLLKTEKVISVKDSWNNVLFGVAKANTPSAGYKDFIGIHEVLRVSSTIKELILKGAKSEAIEAQAKKEGMITLLEDGIFAAARGLTTIEEVLSLFTKK